jgi:hypothetical protein
MVLSIDRMLSFVPFAPVMLAHSIVFPILAEKNHVTPLTDGKPHHHVLVVSPDHCSSPDIGCHPLENFARARPEPFVPDQILWGVDDL